MPEVASDPVKADETPEPPKRSVRARIRKGLLVIVFVTSVVAACSLLAIEATESFSEPDACINCHEMQDAYDSWTQSPHYVNPSGVKVTCVSCHLPPREDHVAYLASKTWSGAKDAYVHFFGEYDADHARSTVLASMPSERCIRCHDNLLGKPSTPAVGGVHRVAITDVPERVYACVVCHDDMHGAKKPKPIAKVKPIYEPADNSYCYVCHADFESEKFAGVHKAAGVSCVACHGDSEKHADDEEHLTAPDVMYPKNKINASCTTDECHSVTVMKEPLGHRSFYADAESSKKLCTDCHGKHRVPERTRTWDKATGTLTWTDGGESKSGGDMSDGGMSDDGTSDDGTSGGGTSDDGTSDDGTSDP